MRNNSFLVQDVPGKIYSVNMWTRHKQVEMHVRLLSFITKQELSMSTNLLSSLWLPATRPERTQGRPSPDTSLKWLNPGNGIKLSQSLGRLLLIPLAALIFVALPIGNAVAQIPLPGSQFPSARTPTFDRKESVLDRFRAFSGKKTPTALEGLFTRWDPVFSQNPAIVLSDGTTVAHITLRLQGRSGEPPNFSISGGHCVSAKMTEPGNWILDILPKRGSISTSLTVEFSGQMTEYPLTVAPPLDLFDSKTADAAVRDYVTTANHLAAPSMVPDRK